MYPDFIIIYNKINYKLFKNIDEKGLLRDYFMLFYPNKHAGPNVNYIPKP